MQLQRYAVALALAALLWATPARAALYGRGPTNNCVSTTSCVLTNPPIVTGHNHVWFALFANDGTSVSCAAGWSTLADSGSWAGFSRMWVCYHSVSGGEGASTTFTIGSTGNGVIAFIIDAADESGSPTSTTGNGGAPITLGTLTPSGEEDYFLACDAWTNSNIGTGGLSTAFPAQTGGGTWTYSTNTVVKLLWLYGRSSSAITPVTNGGNMGCVAWLMPSVLPSVKSIPNIYTYSDNNCGSASCTVTAPPSHGPGDTIWAAAQDVRSSNTSSKFSTIPAGFVTVQGPDLASGGGSFPPYSGLFCKNAGAAEPGSYTWGVTAPDVLGHLRMWTVANMPCPSASSGSYADANSVSTITSASFSLPQAPVPVFVQNYSAQSPISFYDTTNGAIEIASGFPGTNSDGVSMIYATSTGTSPTIASTVGGGSNFLLAEAGGGLHILLGSAMWPFP